MCFFFFLSSCIAWTMSLYKHFNSQQRCETGFSAIPSGVISSPRVHTEIRTIPEPPLHNAYMLFQLPDKVGSWRTDNGDLKWTCHQTHNLNLLNQGLTHKRWATVYWGGDGSWGRMQGAWRGILEGPHEIQGTAERKHGGCYCGHFLWCWGLTMMEPMLLSHTTTLDHVKQIHLIGHSRFLVGSTLGALHFIFLIPSWLPSWLSMPISVPLH